MKEMCRLDYAPSKGMLMFDDNYKVCRDEYITICDSISEDQCREFIAKMMIKYHLMCKTGKIPVLPDLQHMKDEFANFLLS